MKERIISAAADRALYRKIEEVARAHLQGETSTVFASHVFHAIKQYRQSGAGRKRARAPRVQVLAAERIAAAATRAAKIIKQETSKDLPGFDAVRTLDFWAHRRTGRSLNELASELEAIAVDAERHAEHAKDLSAQNLDNQLTPVLQLAECWTVATRTVPDFSRRGAPSPFIATANKLLSLFRLEVADPRTIVKDGLAKWREDLERHYGPSWVERKLASFA